MMEIRLKSTFLELLFVCLCLLTVLGPANGKTVIRVKEGSEAVLPCFIRPKQKIEGEYFDWRKVVQKDENKEVFEYDAGRHSNNNPTGQDEQFKGRVSHFPDQLQSGDASIVIRDTKLSDSGTYTCDFPRFQPNRQTFTIDLVVDCILKDRSQENIPGASLKPHVTSLNHTRVQAQLQCKVQGVSPKPEVKWQDSSGNVLPAEEPQVTERGGSYDINLKTPVTKTDTYHCIITQEEICHQVSAETYVYIHESLSGWIVGAVLGPLFVFIVVGVVLAVLYKKGFITINSTKRSQTETERDEEKNPGESVELNKMPDTMTTETAADDTDPDPVNDLSFIFSRLRAAFW